MRRLFLLISLVVFLDTAFYAAISPLLPRYSEELDLSKTAAGVLTAAYAAGTLAGSIPGGWLASRAGVKPTLLLGLGLLAATSLVFGLANDIVLLDVARFVQGIGGACSWSAGMAWLVGASPPERRGEVIGSGLAAAIIGVLFGPVLGGAATVVGPELVFGAVALVALALAGWAWTEPGVPPAEETSLRRLGSSLGNPAVATGLWLFLLPALFAGVLEVLAPLRLDDLGASGVAIGGVFLLAAGVEAAISPVAGRLSDRRGRLVPIRAGLAGAAAMAIALPLTGNALLQAAAVVLAIAALGTFWAPAMAMLSEAVEGFGLDQGLGFAVTNIAWAGGHVIGGGAGARLADAFGDGLPYALLAFLCGVTLLGVLRQGRPVPAAAD
ncbi:MAG TPA: MFS transporter [Thermoleophilaceae bacterium]|nr:MFS transporter [Thermoleophilaceae bacterium]